MADHEAPKNKTLLNSTVYDITKDAITIVYPAAITLYAGMAVIWGWGFSEEIIASAGLIGVFLGVILKVSSKQYANQPVDYNGELVVNMTDPLKENYSLQIDKPWDELANLNEVRIKVVDES